MGMLSEAFLKLLSGAVTVFLIFSIWDVWRYLVLGIDPERHHSKLFPFLDQLTQDETRRELAERVFEIWDLEPSVVDGTNTESEILTRVLTQAVEKIESNEEVTGERFASLVAFFGETVFPTRPKVWKRKRRRLELHVLDADGEVRAELLPAPVIGEGLRSREVGPIVEDYEETVEVLEMDEAGPW